ncbi:MAG TPA: hypothetical protein PKB06_04460 [Actinotalea sp.]|mgnify:CR=1 FL=1|nr:hypothetical protein [Actinotalea sp.]
MWWLLWTVLVLAGAGVLFLVGRRLWRQGGALLRATTALGELASRLEERTAELTVAAQDAHPVEPVVVQDPERARALWADAAALRARRRARKDARREATFRRWETFSR